MKKTNLLYIFDFIKYIKSTWYFNLKSKDYCVWGDYNSLSDEDKNLINFDNNYSTTQSAMRDAAYQALQKGLNAKVDISEIMNNHKPSITDNYRFIRKYFSSLWVYFIFIIRLFTFKNIFKDIFAIINTANVKKENLFAKCNSINLSTFNSTLIKDNHKVSVVIPTLNRYEFLEDVLRDFEKQDYKNFEIIVVDQSEPFRRDFYEQFDLDINLIYQEEKALWLARNTAIKNAKGKFIALSEDDVRINSDWISLHLKCIDFFDADISAGVFYPEGKQIPKERSFYTIASQFATGNALLYRTVYEAMGLFDRQFEKQRMGDGEFGARCYINGLKSISNPQASCIDIKAATGGLRQMGSWDAFRPRKLFAPRPIPSVLYLARRYFGNKSARIMLLLSVPISIVPYKLKRNKLLMLLSIPIFVIISPLFIFQIMKSWKIASKMIKEGPKINIIDKSK